MNRKNEFKIFMEHHVCDVSTVADRLDELGYFSAPASAGHHGNTDGGLYDHSKMVTLELLNLTEKLGLRWERRDSIYIVGMFHDICKTDDYSREIVREKAADGSVVCETEGKWVYNTDMLLPGVVCFKRLIHHDMSKSLKTYKATKQKGDPHEQTENNRPV